MSEYTNHSLTDSDRINSELNRLQDKYNELTSIINVSTNQHLKKALVTDRKKYELRINYLKKKNNYINPDNNYINLENQYIGVYSNNSNDKPTGKDSYLNKKSNYNLNDVKPLDHTEIKKKDVKSDSPSHLKLVNSIDIDDENELLNRLLKQTVGVKTTIKDCHLVNEGYKNKSLSSNHKAYNIQKKEYNANNMTKSLLARKNNRKKVMTTNSTSEKIFNNITSEKIFNNITSEKIFNNKKDDKSDLINIYNNMVKKKDNINSNVDLSSKKSTKSIILRNNDTNKVRESDCFTDKSKKKIKISLVQCYEIISLLRKLDNSKSNRIIGELKNKTKLLAKNLDKVYRAIY